ncbi:MAG: alanine--glyoxylate aminotransferase family protein [Proteobacteria bacterium]|nr:alanine--glyoxylate aminotransferase family protein [Pseudomonadota bacterium]
MSDTAALPYRLRLPGPTTVPERVRQALAAPVLNHRGPEFHAQFEAIQTALRPIFGTTGPILVFPGSGTGVMEGSLANVARPGEAVLVVANGQYGGRFHQIATALGLASDLLEVEWGLAPDPMRIKTALARRDYRAVCVTHNESSTGVVADLAAIGAVVKDSPAVQIVDTVSGLAGIPVAQDAWHLDVVVAASQKALMCPPGIGLVGVSAKAWALIERDHAGRFFWDFRKARTAQEKAETPFTPPVSLLAGLDEALRMIAEEGLDAVLARHHRLATALRAGVVALGLRLFPREALSDTVTVMHVPDGLDGGAITRHMHQRYRTVIAGSRTHLTGKIIRIGTMGYLSAADVLTDLHYLERTLADLGRAPPAGAGVAAASAALVG